MSTRKTKGKVRREKPVKREIERAAARIAPPEPIDCGVMVPRSMLVHLAELLTKAQRSVIQVASTNVRGYPRIGGSLTDAIKTWDEIDWAAYTLRLLAKGTHPSQDAEVKR